MRGRFCNFTKLFNRLTRKVIAKVFWILLRTNFVGVYRTRPYHILAFNFYENKTYIRYWHCINKNSYNGSKQKSKWWYALPFLLPQDNATLIMQSKSSDRIAITMFWNLKSSCVVLVPVRSTIWLKLIFASYLNTWIWHFRIMKPVERFVCGKMIYWSFYIFKII